MQPRTPPRQVTRWVNGYGAMAVPAVHSNHTKQFDGQLSLPAADTSPDRVGAHDSAVSERMSIRQPVSRAASRAFWPSRPIANES